MLFIDGLFTPRRKAKCQASAAGIPPQLLGDRSVSCSVVTGHILDCHLLEECPETRLSLIPSVLRYRGLLVHLDDELTQGPVVFSEGFRSRLRS